MCAKEFFGYVLVFISMLIARFVTGPRLYSEEFLQKVFHSFAIPQLMVAFVFVFVFYVIKKKISERIYLDEEMKKYNLALKREKAIREREGVNCG